MGLVEDFLAQERPIPESIVDEGRNEFSVPQVGSVWHNTTRGAESDCTVTDVTWRGDTITIKAMTVRGARIALPVWQWARVMTRGAWVA